MKSQWAKMKKSNKRFFIKQKHRSKKRARQYLRRKLERDEAKELRLRNRTIVRKLMDFIRSKYF